MTDHDPICQADPLDDIYFCMCEFIGKVRADEREKVKAEYVPVLMEHLRILADLRAKVEALDVVVTTNNLLGTTRYVRLGDVLALIDGSSDE